MGYTDPIVTQTAGTSELLASDWNTYVRDNISALYPLSMTVSLSDEVTNLSTGDAKLTIRAPFAMTLLTGVWIPRASLSTASSSGLVTVDIDKNGSSIFSTLLTIDANETTSKTAATAAVLGTTSVADDDVLSFNIDGAGTGARGLKVTLYFVRNV